MNDTFQTRNRLTVGSNTEMEKVGSSIKTPQSWTVMRLISFRKTHKICLWAHVVEADQSFWPLCEAHCTGRRKHMTCLQSNHSNNRIKKLHPPSANMQSTALSLVLVPHCTACHPPSQNTVLHRASGIWHLCRKGLKNKEKQHRVGRLSEQTSIIHETSQGHNRETDFTS